MQGLGGLLCLATVAIEALLSVMAAALSGFGLFFRVSFRWGHDDLLRIVMSSIPTYMKETMSHLASISKRQTRGEDAPAPPSYKPFMMNGFHGVSSENPHQCLLKVMFGKARHLVLEMQFFWLVHHINAATIHVELPPVIDAAQATFFVAAKKARDPP